MRKIARFLVLPASLLFFALVGLTIYNHVVELHTIVSRTIVPAPESPAAFAAPFIPRSFIPGGFHSIAEFQHALKTDELLKSQYGDFDFSHARFERLGHPECLFVAYRSGPKFAWTRRCKILPAGELILTDGKTRIRARCGNLLSAKPEAPTFASEIDDDLVIDMPESRVIPAPPDAPTGLSAQVPPPPSPIIPLQPPADPPAVPGVPVCTNCRRSVPDAGSALAYVLAGLLVCAVAINYRVR